MDAEDLIRAEFPYTNTEYSATDKYEERFTYVVAASSVSAPDNKPPSEVDFAGNRYTLSIQEHS